MNKRSKLTNISEIYQGFKSVQWEKLILIYDSRKRVTYENERNSFSYVTLLRESLQELIVILIKFTALFMMTFYNSSKIIFARLRWSRGRGGWISMWKKKVTLEEPGRGAQSHQGNIRQIHTFCKNSGYNSSCKLLWCEKEI